MTTTIQEVILSVNDLLIAGVSNLLHAYDYPPDSLPDELVMITYYGGGTSEPHSSGMLKDLYNINCDFYVFAKELWRDVYKLMENIDDIRNTLVADTTLGGKVSTYEILEITAPIPTEYAGVPALMMRFILRNVKMNGAR